MTQERPMSPAAKERLRKYYQTQLARLDNPTSTINKPRKTSTKSLDAITKSREIWQHNSFIGHATMAQKNMSAIMHSATASNHAQDLAEKIATLAIELEKDLRTVRLETY